uniref:Uncharacterized protein n=1 Tax=Oryza punctata TaxID=4537 RepID=A0A0E0L8X3_ORYPU
MDQARKKGRGTFKGYKVAKKRFNNASQTLPIEFSTRLGGPIVINYRSFVEEVVLFMKRKAPIIGKDKETGEEPNLLDLWKATHMKDDKWSNTTANDVYVRIFLMSYIIVQYYRNIFKVNGVTCSFLLFLGNCTQKI